MCCFMIQQVKWIDVQVFSKQKKSGQERFRTVTTSFYRGCKGLLLVLDLSAKDPWTELGYWVKESQKYDISTCILIGNKSDKERTISRVL